MTVQILCVLLLASDLVEVKLKNETKKQALAAMPLFGHMKIQHRLTLLSQHLVKLVKDGM